MLRLYPAGWRLPAGLLLVTSLLPGPAARAQLAVTTALPAANARAVAPASPVSVGFNQPLTSGSAAALKVFSSQRGGLRSRGGTPALVSGSLLQFTPAAYPFVPGETVYTTLTTAAASVGGPLARPRVAQFTVATGGTGTGNFLPPALNPNPTVGLNVYSIATGDLDGDGDLDLVTANLGVGGVLSNIVSVRLNDGQGSFGGGSDLVTATDPSSVALGDLDSDGDLDLVCANYYGRTLSIRLNDGAANFTSPASGADIAVPTDPSGVALGDLDGDGDLDLVTADLLANTISTRLNDGTGNFSSLSGQMVLPVGAGPRNVALGDMDGDGDLDLLAADSDSNTVSLYLNNWPGRFTRQASITVDNGPFRVVLGDVDGDGDLDLLTPNYGTNTLGGTTVSVRLNDGQGTFVPPAINPNPSVGFKPVALALGDIDADGDLDFVAGNLSQGSTSVRLNNGQGVFTVPATAPSQQLGNSLQYVALADVDGDADLDLLAGTVGNYVGVRLNYSAQGPLPAVSIQGDSLLCGGGQVQLTAAAAAGVLAYRWNTGATTATIAVMQPGTYSVTATFSGGQTRTAQRRVVAIAPVVQLSGDSLLCAGGTLTLHSSAPGATALRWSTGATTPDLVVSQPGLYTLTAQYGSGCTVSRRLTVRLAALSLSGPAVVCQGGGSTLTAVAAGATAFRWSTGATTPSISVGQAGTYSVAASFGSNCTLSASQTVTQPVAHLSGDSVGCPGRPLTLTATQAGATAYRWSTGATTASISVGQSGTYSVVVTYASGCQSTARQQVRFLPALAAFTLGADTTICEGSSVVLRPVPAGPSGTTYRWSTGATSPTLTVQQPGTYSLQLTSSCQTQSATRTLRGQPCLSIPNIITPNGDQRNDRFVVAGLSGDWALQLYSRWGQPVLSTDAYHNDWGDEATPGLYYYLLRRAGITYRGWLEVVR